jgi:thiol-disulfide isomerase/thioredoxin
MSVQVYQFSKVTCPPCNAIKPSMMDLKEEFSHVPWETVVIDTDRRGLAAQFNVTSVPTMVTVARDANGNIVHTERHSGTNIAGYYRIVRNLLRFIV